MNLVRGLVFFGWSRRFEVRYLGMVDELRFRMFEVQNFQVGSNTKCSVRFFGRLGVRFQRTNLGSEGSGSSRFGVFRFVPNLFAVQLCYLLANLKTIFFNNFDINKVYKFLIFIMATIWKRGKCSSTDIRRIILGKGSRKGHHTKADDCG